MPRILILLWVLSAAGGASATDAAADPRGPTESAAASADEGYRLLTEKAYLPLDFDQQTFDAIWQVWPAPLRHSAESATVEQRRQMAMDRYGLTPRPGDPAERPLQYVVDDRGNWTMNCLACHGGSVYGRPTPGAPNQRYALQTLSEEMRRIKFRLGKPWTRMDLGSAIIPLGTTRGTTNAVMFGVALMHFRDTELKVLDDRSPPPMTHHDMDAPAWWYFHKRPAIYIDGFAQRGHRGLMQFMLVRENGPEKFREWEDDFRHVYAYLMSLRPPRYDGPVDERLAQRGRRLFNETCAECHGTYGDEWTYPNRRVPLSELGTDPVRLAALPVEGREKYADSWFAHGGTQDRQHTVTDPDGYVAPPLDGVWASPPYLHNGSVPTLWHLLHPDERPVLWRPTSQAIDHHRIGLQIEEVESIPLSEADVAVRREYFDTRRYGKSAAGHDYPDLLSEDEKRAVLEYLKTL